MKRFTIILTIVALTALTTLAQKAHDVLEDGIPIEENENIFLKVSGDILKYYIGETPTRPVTIEDSIIFLVKNSSVNVYLKPINPLRYSYNTENKIIIDQIDEDAANALKSVTDLFNKYGVSPPPDEAKKDEKPKIDKYDDLLSTTDSINNSLKISQKELINQTFVSLSDLTFSEEIETKKSIDNAKLVIDIVKIHFEKIDKKIKAYRVKIETYDSSRINDILHPLAVKNIFNLIANDFQKLYDEQFKRYTNLFKAYTLTKDAYNEAIQNREDGLTWVFFLDEVPAAKGKISVYTITINNSGYKLSTDNEIIVDETKQKIKTTIRIRRFQRFIPEVSTGIAYTDLRFPQYSTMPDTSNGKLYIVNADEEKINKVNISAMLNYNYYIQNSPVHPFIQLGVGANINFPTLFVGGGLRLTGGGKGRIAISAGAAASWIKSLDKLSVGDEVSGEADLDNDIKYQFASPKWYFGIQYNF